MPFAHLTMNVSLMRSAKTEDALKMRALSGNAVLEGSKHQKWHVDG